MAGTVLTTSLFGLSLGALAWCQRCNRGFHSGIWEGLKLIQKSISSTSVEVALEAQSPGVSYVFTAWLFTLGGQVPATASLRSAHLPH